MKGFVPVLFDQRKSPVPRLQSVTDKKPNNLFLIQSLSKHFASHPNQSKNFSWLALANTARVNTLPLLHLVVVEVTTFQEKRTVKAVALSQMKLPVCQNLTYNTFEFLRFPDNNRIFLKFKSIYTFSSWIVYRWTNKINGPIHLWLYVLCSIYWW